MRVSNISCLSKAALRSVTLLLAILGTGVGHAATIDLTSGLWTPVGFGDVFPWTGTTLHFTSQTTNGSNFNLQGYFAWHASGVYQGDELFSGTLFDNLILEIDGFSIVNVQPGAPSLALAHYRGQVTADGNHIINGTWGLSSYQEPGKTWFADRVVIPEQIPEPGTMTLLGCGALGLLLFRRKLF